MRLYKTYNLLEGNRAVAAGSPDHKWGKTIDSVEEWSEQVWGDEWTRAAGDRSGWGSVTEDFILQRTQIGPWWQSFQVLYFLLMVATSSSSPPTISAYLVWDQSESFKSMFIAVERSGYSGAVPCQAESFRTANTEGNGLLCAQFRV